MATSIRSFIAHLLELYLNISFCVFSIEIKSNSTSSHNIIILSWCLLLSHKQYWGSCSFMNGSAVIWVEWEEARFPWLSRGGT